MCQYVYFRARLTLYKWVFSVSLMVAANLKMDYFKFSTLGWANPFRQNLIWWLRIIIIIYYLKRLLFYLQHPWTFFLVLFTPKQRNKKVQSLNQKHGPTPFWEKTNVVTIKNQYFYCLKGLLFYLEHPEMLKDLLPLSVFALNFSPAGTVTTV